jgi:glycosyltransferase involved in cell wall biosynthesis
MRERVGGLLRRDGIDAFWAASMALPRCPAGIPGILSVYDVVHVVARSSMSHAGRLVADLFFAGDLDRADSTVAISRGTAERIAVLYGRMVDAIARPDAEPDFAPAAPEAVAAVRARHGLDGRYALTVGTLEPRKNYPLLVRAIAEAKARDRLGDLVMAVAGRSGWGGDALAGSGGLPVRQLGFVDRADLPALMTGAEALLFPTAYEGFGMPALEAARCGTPVVAGDLPELHEAAGDALRTCPLTVEGLADALADIAAGRIARPRPAAARGWDDAARTMWDEIDRTLARPGRADQADGVASVHTRSPWRAR